MDDGVEGDMPWDKGARQMVLRSTSLDPVLTNSSISSRVSLPAHYLCHYSILQVQLLTVR